MEIELDGCMYAAASKLDVFTQFHIARKLGPALGIVDSLVDSRNADKNKVMLSVLMFSRISDADAQYVINKCLGTVSRRQDGGKLSKIQLPDGTMMFSDIKLKTLLDLTIAVVEDNLGDFFRTSLASLE